MKKDKTMKDCGCSGTGTGKYDAGASTSTGAPDDSVLDMPNYPASGGVDMPAEGVADNLRGDEISMPGYPHSGGQAMPAAGDTAPSERPDYYPMPQ